MIKAFITKHYKIATRLVAGLVFLWAAPGCVNRLFYHPNSIAYRSPESMGAPVTEHYFESLDGTKLHGWFVEAATTNVLGTVVHFHGNAQNLTAHSTFVEWLPASGYQVFMFDYRGYGKSEGRPSRKGLFQDGVAVLHYVRTLPQVDTNRVVILGQSLGGTTAMAVAGRHPELAGQAMIIDSAFYSYRRIVRDKIALIPLLSLLRVPLSWVVISDAYGPSPTLPNISPTPILFMHGTADQVIPVHHAHMLYKRAADPRDILIIEGGQHISGFYAQRADTVPYALAFLSNALHQTKTEIIPTP